MAEEITQLLVKWSNGDASAAAELIPAVYAQLRRLAAQQLRHERGEHTLQPTALVHEAFLRLINQQEINLQNRAQFFGLAATLMRNILVDHARGRRAQKRGGAEIRLSLRHVERAGNDSDRNLLALDDAMCDLAAVKPQHARIVELRYFGGLTIAETAQVLGLSHATVERDWAFARAWLKKELSG